MLRPMPHSLHADTILSHTLQVFLHVRPVDTADCCTVSLSQLSNDCYNFFQKQSFYYYWIFYYIHCDIIMNYMEFYRQLQKAVVSSKLELEPIQDIVALWDCLTASILFSKRRWRKWPCRVLARTKSQIQRNANNNGPLGPHQVVWDSRKDQKRRLFNVLK